LSINNNLIVAAAKVARVDPEAWRAFLGALSVYNEVQRTMCIMSPIETLPVAQGNARAVAQILGLLEDCQNVADKIERKAK
jgi:hypothetical protein